VDPGWWAAQQVAGRVDPSLPSLRIAFEIGSRSWGGMDLTSSVIRLEGKTSVLGVRAKSGEELGPGGAKLCGEGGADESGPDDQNPWSRATAGLVALSGPEHQGRRWRDLLAAAPCATSSRGGRADRAENAVCRRVFSSPEAGPVRLVGRVAERATRCRHLVGHT
jgi:hypothetical protein